MRRVQEKNLLKIQKGARKEFIKETEGCKKRNNKGEGRGARKEIIKETEGCKKIIHKGKEGGKKRNYKGKDGLQENKLESVMTRNVESMQHMNCRYAILLSWACNNFLASRQRQRDIVGPTSLADQTSEVSPAMSPVICSLQ